MSNKLEGTPKAESKLVRFKQRALVFQGGGALGAYEAGAFRAFYDWLAMQTYDEDENIFDIVAGTSIGAINASIIINEVIQKKREAKKGGLGISQKACWEETADKLENFWLTRVNTYPLSSLYVNNFWQYGSSSMGNSNSMMAQWFPNVASQEAARKYFAAKESIFFGSMGVFSSASPIYDTKYFDFSNTWYRSANQRLKDTLSDYISYPIKTSVNENEPRLLSVSVDVMTGQAATFDSYETIEEDQNGNIQRDANGKPVQSNHTSFLDSIYASEDGDGKKMVTIRYEHGLAVEHILASASVPINFDFQWIPLHYDYKDSSTLANANLKTCRPFWDGGIMSNTPLEELLKAHRKFWINEIGQTVLRENIWEIPLEVMHGPINSKYQPLVPNLDVYMINVWPREIDGHYLPRDHDLTQARQNDIKFGDKTQKDEIVAEMITDYSTMIKKIRKEAIANAKDRQRMSDELWKILNESTNPNHTGESKEIYATNEDLMLGVFDVEKVLRVERNADKDAIFSMMLDFSTETITELIAKGRQDALLQIINHAIELVKRSSSAANTTSRKEHVERLLSNLEQAKGIIESGSDLSTYHDALQKLKEFVMMRDNTPSSTIVKPSSKDQQSLVSPNVQGPISTAASSLHTLIRY